jgi:hypothetical protein
MMSGRLLFVFALILMLFHLPAQAESISSFDKDPHRNALGFFDLHVCNWPDRPPFFKALFSTTHIGEIENMEIYLPDGKLLGELQLWDYMKIKRKGKPEKRVYLNDIDVPEGAGDGWYDIKVTTKEGKTYHARDYVVMTLMPRASGMSPPDGAENIPMPKELSWAPVPGAAYYQVFVREAFEDKRIVYSKLLKEPRYQFKPGKLKPGGDYVWSVHARDINEHILLGDFNQGSQSYKAEFSVAESEAGQ